MKLAFIIFLFVSNALAYEFIPQNVDESTPVFFTLHGCKQTEEDLLADSFLREKASSKVIFFAPRQTINQNIDKCWNWFFPFNQMNMPFSETRMLMAKLDYFLIKNGLQNNPIYLIGFSAGAAQSLNLLACYPKRFKGIAAHSGLAYRVTDQVMDVNEVIAYGPKKSTLDLIKDFNSCTRDFESFYDKKMIFFHGSEDLRVSLKNFKALESQMLESYDYRDDRRLNKSVKITKVITNHVSSGGLRYRKSDYSIDKKASLQFYLVDGLKHDWSGGPYRVERNDPMGPDATDIILKTFLSD